MPATGAPTPPSPPAPPPGRGEAAAAGSPSQGAPAGPTAGRAGAVRALAGRRRRENVAVLLFGGGPILESSIPLSVFGVDRQEAGVPRYRLLVCAGEKGPLRTTGGLMLTAPHGMEALARAGTVVVPSWRSISSPPPAEILEALRQAHAEGARIVGLCTGAFVLAAAGLLDGRAATTHWMYAPTLAKRYPDVHVDPREAFVDDGGVMTSSTTASGIDLCLHIVRSDHGADAAGALARRLVLPARRTDSRAPLLDRSLPEEMGGDPLAEVVAWALEHLHEQFDVEALANRAYMSRRTFDRRFRTLTGSAPLQWLITQRVLQAQRLLETGDHSIEEVAQRCGFRSPVALRGHFRRQLGVSPATYRATFRARRAEQGGAPPVDAPLPEPRPVGGGPSLPSGGPGGQLTAGAGSGAGGAPGDVPRGHDSGAGPGNGTGTAPAARIPRQQGRGRAPSSSARVPRRTASARVDGQLPNARPR
ncbi:GlxA family transcriptional regulator [Mangrovactinospora gilvigrisea]|uniref:GlxA family transcriptional regulator n=1 Tax=Mangrovactinospora gilvigrisea TaxID=1428644 RepID=UPI0009A0DD62|nr:helix-turn-helix domain-containing protein [Mangrovactinospora gilvigrisea]